MRSRLTRDGRVVLLGAIGLAVVAWLSANNLLYLVAAPVWATLIVGWPLGRANVMGIKVRRRLPPELYAGRDALGGLLVYGPALRWSSAEIVVLDEGTGAHGAIDTLPRGQWSEVRVRWRFPRRGGVRLSGFTVRSVFPFGLWEHQRRLAAAADVLVYPRPLPSRGQTRASFGQGAREVTRSGGSGDVVDLRDYRAGDALRRIHWPTSARLGRLILAERAEERAPAIYVSVDGALTGPAWERELSLACGEVRRALAAGHAVGLRIEDGPKSPSRRFPAAHGGQWRRVLLDALALMPRRDR